MKEIKSLEELKDGDVVRFEDLLNKNFILTLKLFKRDTTNNDGGFYCKGLNHKFMEKPQKDEDYIYLHRGEYELDNSNRDLLEKKYPMFGDSIEEIIDEGDYIIIKTTEVKNKVIKKNIPTYWKLYYIHPNGGEDEVFGASDKLYKLTKQEVFMEIL